jgi:predicted ATPase
MPSFILTGAPGAGKTAVLRLLEVRGHPVIEEAATDVIALGHALGLAEPWQERDFIGKVLALQLRRQESALALPRRQESVRALPRRQESVHAGDGAVAFFDRSPVCTLALSRYLGACPSPVLAGEIDRAVAEGGYETTAFFIRNQGFVAATAARRISFEDSLRFEQIHEQAYRELGFRLVEVPAGPLTDRVALIRQTVGRLTGGGG